MINYKGRMKMKHKPITINKLKEMVAARLQMQSCRRALEFDYKIKEPRVDMNYFESKDFVDNYFNKWSELTRRAFIKGLAGPDKESMIKFQEYITKQ